MLGATQTLNIGISGTLITTRTVQIKRQREVGWLPVEESVVLGVVENWKYICPIQRRQLILVSAFFFFLPYHHVGPGLPDLIFSRKTRNLNFLTCETS